MKRFWFLLVVALLFLAPSQRVLGHHWSNWVEFTPTNVVEGMKTTFYFTLHNTANSTLTVNWAKLHFCWTTSTTDPYLTNGSIVTVAALASFLFIHTLDVPDYVAIDCQATISVNGQASGDLFGETIPYTYNLQVTQVQPLSAFISASPNYQKAPMTVDFSADIFGGYGSFTYRWSFGDGGISNSAKPQHTYYAAGTYNATVIVTDSRGKQTSNSIPVIVTPKTITPFIILLAILPMPIIFLKRRPSAS